MAGHGQRADAPQGKVHHRAALERQPLADDRPGEIRGSAVGLHPRRRVSQALQAGSRGLSIGGGLPQSPAESNRDGRSSPGRPACGARRRTQDRLCSTTARIWSGRPARPDARSFVRHRRDRLQRSRAATGGMTIMAGPINHAMTTTGFTLEGYRVTKNLGVVRGVTVRSRSIFGTIGAGLQTLVGGNITLLTDLCEKTRADAFMLMLQHASELGANAVVGIDYDATEVMQGVTEVLCYGTAQIVAPASNV